MEVVAQIDYNTPRIPLTRLDGSNIKEIGSSGDVNEAVVLFAPNGRLVFKDIRIFNYWNISSKNLNVNGKDYYINTYTGRLIKQP